MLDEFLGGGGGEAERAIWAARGATCHLGSWRQGLILFPRSERVKSDPRSIDTLKAQFPAVLALESCDFATEKCGCSRGPK